MNKVNKDIELVPLKIEDYSNFKEEVKKSFIKGINDIFQNYEDPLSMGPIPSDEVLQDSLTSRTAESYYILYNNKVIGGVIVNINKKTNHIKVDILFLNENSQGLGLGAKTWNAIERYFPSIKSWELVTPYFEKRNIYFYINKCGFHITELFKEKFMIADELKEFDFFRFEKKIV